MHISHESAHIVQSCSPTRPVRPLRKLIRLERSATPKTSFLHLLLLLAKYPRKALVRARQRTPSCRPLGILRTKSLRWQSSEGRPRRSALRSTAADGRTTRATRPIISERAHTPVTTTTAACGTRPITFTRRWRRGGCCSRISRCSVATTPRREVKREWSPAREYSLLIGS